MRGYLNEIPPALQMESGRGTALNRRVAGARLRRLEEKSFIDGVRDLSPSRADLASDSAGS
jgi:hypothetical protein